MKRLAWLLLIVAGLAVWVGFVQAIIVDHWIFHPLGQCSGAHCKGYQFWSGIAGTVLFSTGLYGGILLAIRHHNCHAKTCWRPGKYKVEGTPYVVCKKHHPHVPDEGATAEHIAAAHEKAMAGAVRVRSGR